MGWKEGKTCLSYPGSGGDGGGKLKIRLIKGKKEHECTCGWGPGISSPHLGNFLGVQQRSPGLGLQNKCRQFQALGRGSSLHCPGELSTYYELCSFPTCIVSILYS